jgi:threonine/homoserine/homoserine lactone efflux protein
MFNLDVWLAFTAACLALTVSPGPGNMLAIGKGLSQGKLAAVVVAISIGTGTLFHVLAATFGFTLLIHTSELAFVIVKIVGAAYLIWIGAKIILKRNLINLETVEKEPLKSIFITGFFTVLLNPRAGIFVLAFIPQFVNPEAGSFTIQMIAYGTWFAILSVLILSLMGIFAEKMSYWLKERPKFVLILNISAGLIFLSSGFAVTTMDL